MRYHEGIIYFAKLALGFDYSTGIASDLERGHGFANVRGKGQKLT